MMSKRQKLWHFVYFPDDDYLMSLGDPSTKPFNQLVATQLSDYGQQELRDKNWKTFVIDVELTSYWRKAYEIASQHFGTRNPCDIDNQISQAQENINAEREERRQRKIEHSEYLKSSRRSIKRSETYLSSLVKEKESHS